MQRVLQHNGRSGEEHHRWCGKERKQQHHFPGATNSDFVNGTVGVNYRCR